jgi:hypothetical protein
MRKILSIALLFASLLLLMPQKAEARVFFRRGVFVHHAAIVAPTVVTAFATPTFSIATPVTAFSFVQAVPVAAVPAVPVAAVPAVPATPVVAAAAPAIIAQPVVASAFVASPVFASVSVVGVHDAVIVRRHGFFGPRVIIRR